MKLHRSFLKRLISIAALSLIHPSCSTARDRVPVPSRSSKVEDSREVKVLYGMPNLYFQDEGFRKIVASDSPDRSTRAFEYYCRDGKQIRDLSYKLKIIIPNAPKGIPIDSAAAIRQRVATELRRAARNFFTSIDYFYYGASRTKDNEDDQKTEELEFQNNKKEYEAIQGENFIDDYLARRVFEEYIEEDRQRFDQSNMSLAEQGFKPYVFVKQKEGNPILVIYNYPSRGGPGHEFKGKSYAVEYETPIYTGTTKKQINSSLVHAMPGEIGFLAGAFTFLIPPKAYNRIMKRSLSSDEPSQEATDLPPSASAADRVNVGQAIRNRSRLWSVYAGAFSSSKEAPTKDPNVWSAEARLDLNVFCRYGKPVDSLLSK